MFSFFHTFGSAFSPCLAPVIISFSFTMQTCRTAFNNREDLTDCSFDNGGGEGTITAFFNSILCAESIPQCHNLIKAPDSTLNYMFLPLPIHLLFKIQLLWVTPASCKVGVVGCKLLQDKKKCSIHQTRILFSNALFVPTLIQSDL